MFNINSTNIRLCLSIAILSAVVVLPACQKKVSRLMTKTYPVTGKVIVEKGRLTPGSNITFTPENPEFVARGIIAEDGRFTLSTVCFDKKLPGACEGKHRVAVTPAITADGDEAGTGMPVTLKEPCIVEPKENNFTIKVKLKK